MIKENTNSNKFKYSLFEFVYQHVILLYDLKIFIKINRLPN